MRRVALRFGSAAVVLSCFGVIWLGECSRLEAANELTVPIVYAERALGAEQPAAGGSVVARASSARLMVLEPGGVPRALVDANQTPGAPTDITDPDVRWDGQRIVFAGFSTADGAFRIHEVNADGSGLHQITHTNRQTDLARYGSAAQGFEVYDDADPCYMPDGRICFVSTRYPGFAPSKRGRATNLYVVNADGSDVHRITSERFGADTPAVSPTSGKIFYSRWWLSARETTPPPGGNTPERPPVYYGPVVNANNFSPLILRGIEDNAFEGVNNWFIASINPDGSGMTMESGYGLNRELTMAYRPTFLADASLVAHFIRESPVLGRPQANGLRRLPALPGLPVPLGGPQGFSGNAILVDPNPAVPVRDVREPAFLYSNTQPLPDGRMLVTGHPGSNASNDMGIYVQENAPRNPTRVVDEPGVAEMDAVALVSRPVPPVIPEKATTLGGYEESPLNVEEAKIRGGTFHFTVENIFANAPVNTRMSNAPPIGRNLSIEFYMNPQREGTLKPEAPILIGSRPIGPDGKVDMELPAGVPLFEILRRPDGLIGLGRDGQAFHVGGMNFGVQGAQARCVGCHAGHSQLPVLEDASFTNHAPSAIVSANSSRASDPNVATGFFAPPVLVDRLTDKLSSEWAAGVELADGDEPRVQLRWIQPLSAKSIVIYGVATGDGFFGPRTLVVHGFTLTTYLRGEIVEERTVRSDVLPAGTAVSWNTDKPFDALAVTIARADAEGVFEGQSSPALAEIEVISRPAGDDPPTILVQRGDVNCDKAVNATDAILILNRLFRGGGPFCCEDAADVTSDSFLNLTDPVFLLNYLFRGGQRPAGGEKCARVTGSVFSCEQEACN